MPSDPLETSKPNLLILQPCNAERNEYARLNNVEPFVKALENDFRVTVHAGKLDMKGLIEEHSPDLILIDIYGLKASIKIDVGVLGVDAYPEIPRVALLLDDGHAADKPFLMQFCQYMRVEAYFCVDTAMRSYAGEFTDQVYLYPWFVNSQFYRDYGEEKEFPIGLFGHGFKLDADDLRYPWRQDMAVELMGQLPFISYPRPDKKTPHNLIGEAYARMLNRCYMAFSCGAIRQYFVKKMLEIPACNSCLVVEETPVVREMGFEDGVNCLMVTKDNVVEKCREMLNEPEKLKEITDNGRQHVLQNHVPEKRKQIVEWYRLRKDLKPGQFIKQSGVSSLFEISETQTAHIQWKDESPFLKALDKAIAALKSNELELAVSTMESLETNIEFAGEVRFYIALSYLMARKRSPLKHRIRRYCNIVKANPNYVDPAITGMLLLALYYLEWTKELEEMAAILPNSPHPFVQVVQKRLNVKLPTHPIYAEDKSCFAYPGRSEQEANKIVDLVLGGKVQELARWWRSR